MLLNRRWLLTASTLLHHHQGTWLIRRVTNYVVYLPVPLYTHYKTIVQVKRKSKVKNGRELEHNNQRRRRQPKQEATTKTNRRDALGV